MPSPTTLIAPRLALMPVSSREAFARMGSSRAGGSMVRRRMRQLLRLDRHAAQRSRAIAPRPRPPQPRNRWYFFFFFFCQTTAAEYNSRDGITFEGLFENRKGRTARAELGSKSAGYAEARHYWLGRFGRRFAQRDEMRALDGGWAGSDADFSRLKESLFAPQPRKWHPDCETRHA